MSTARQKDPEERTRVKDELQTSFTPNKTAVIRLPSLQFMYLETMEQYFKMYYSFFYFNQWGKVLSPPLKYNNKK